MTVLELSRTLPYPAERVWQAFTDPAALAAWFWPVRAATTVEIELRVGGRYRISGPGFGMAVTGHYQVIEPPRRLVFTWRWDGDPEETLVTLGLTAEAGGTRLTVRHEAFGDDAERDEHAKGWSDCLDRLPGWAAG
jgi:uncharacterized protein YndB with AHSA1/START domain